MLVEVSSNDRYELTVDVVGARARRVSEEQRLRERPSGGDLDGLYDAHCVSSNSKRGYGK